MSKSWTLSSRLTPPPWAQSVNLIPETTDDIELLRQLFLSLPEDQRQPLESYDPKLGAYLGVDGSLQFYYW